MPKRILIVDDEEDVRKIIAVRLKAEGYEVMLAADGLAGLELAKREKPDLIVLDVMMPKVDGYHVCALLKFDEKYSQIPIILLTAKGQAEDNLTGLIIKADAYMVKPFDAEKLLAKIGELIKK